MNTFTELEAWKNGGVLDQLFDRANWAVGYHITPQKVTLADGTTDYILTAQAGMVNVSVVSTAAEMTSAQGTTAKLVIFDQRDNSVWTYRNNAWVREVVNDTNRPYKPGQILRSSVNGKSFVANANLALVQMGKFTPGT